MRINNNNISVRILYNIFLISKFSFFTHFVRSLKFAIYILLYMLIKRNYFILFFDKSWWCDLQCNCMLKTVNLIHKTLIPSIDYGLLLPVAALVLHMITIHNNTWIKTGLRITYRVMSAHALTFTTVYDSEGITQ